MGERGPPPKPTAMKLAAGNPGGRPLNGDEPIPPPGEPTPPDWLPPRAREIWDELVPRMAAIGLARKIDGGPLARYCLFLYQFEVAAAFVEANGQAYAHPVQPPRKKKGESGQGGVSGFRLFPQVKLLSDLNNQLVKLEREFGLTPSARTRIRAQPPSTVPPGTAPSSKAKDDGRDDYQSLKYRMFGSA